jgi:hypothetical protein
MPVATPAAGSDDGELGYAPIDPAGRATVIATVYYDVVQRVAQRTGLNARELLGRAVAHELGHLLLRARPRPERPDAAAVDRWELIRTAR